jgi:hypothetical protein
MPQTLQHMKVNETQRRLASEGNRAGLDIPRIMATAINSTAVESVVRRWASAFWLKSPDTKLGIGYQSRAVPTKYSRLRPFVPRTAPLDNVHSMYSLTIGSCRRVAGCLTTFLQTTLNRRAGQTVKSERLEFVSPPQLTLRWWSLANSPKEAESGAVSADMTHRMVSTHPTAPMLTDDTRK